MEIDPVAAHQVGHAVPALHQAAGAPTMYGHQYVGTPLGGSPLRGPPPQEESVPALGRGGGAVPVLHQREQVLAWAALPSPWPENPNAGRDSAHLASSRSEIQFLEQRNTQIRNEAVQALESQRERFERVAHEYEFEASDRTQAEVAKSRASLIQEFNRELAQTKAAEMSQFAKHERMLKTEAEEALEGQKQRILLEAKEHLDEEQRQFQSAMFTAEGNLRRSESYSHMWKEQHDQEAQEAESSTQSLRQQLESLQQTAATSSLTCQRDSDGKISI